MMNDQQLEICVGSTGVSVDVQVTKEQTGWNSPFIPFITIEILCTKDVCLHTKTVWLQRAVSMLAAHWRVLEEQPPHSCFPEG